VASFSFCVSLVSDEEALNWLDQREKSIRSAENIRSVKGPEFVAKELRQWLAKVETLCIKRGSPREKGHVRALTESCGTSNGMERSLTRLRRLRW
jgi:hypothetical protein